MQVERAPRIAIEICLIALSISAVNILFPDSPGFHHLYYIPYSAGALLLSAAYGAAAGLFSVAASVAMIAGALPMAFALVHGAESIEGYWRALGTNAAIAGPISVLGVYILGVIRDVARDTEKKLRLRMEKLSRENWLLRQKADALFSVNLELDERVSRQRESITSLHAQLQKLDTLDTNRALEALLETVQIFTGATRTSVWKYDERTDRLALAMSRGWGEDDEAPTSLTLDDTIEGWVFRNTRQFSVRMTLQYDNLKHMDIGRNLITIPLSLQRKSWGVLNIGEMPFEKYNLYTERLLSIIVALAEHSIGEAVSHESIFRTEETDERTGLPLFSQFYRMVEEEAGRAGVRRGDFSVVLIDFTNFAEIVRENSFDDAKGLMSEVANQIIVLSEHRAHVFHYKEDSQLAVIYPNLDSDGVSLFCLETLEKLSSDAWRLHDAVVNIEAVIGFAVSSGDQSADDVLEQAENLLEMQKI